MMENEDAVEIENISNEEFKKRFIEKYKKYRAGQLSEKDFDGYEAFMLSNMLKEESKMNEEELIKKFLNANNS